MAISAAIFWIATVLILYSYFVYPIVVFLIARLYGELPLQEDQDRFREHVSILISAYNEEKIIRSKIENCLNIDYPEDKLKVFVGSDGSTDRTNEIIESIDDARVKYFRFEERNGKSWILNRLVQESTGTFLVFTDANVLFDRDALQHLLQPFVFKNVGGVCGKLKMYLSAVEVSDSAETTYWSLENILKKCEAKIGTVFGATGAIYAVRKKLFLPVPTDRPVVDDFIIPISIVKQGYRVAYAENAVAREETTDDILTEFRRRIRIGARNYNGIRYYWKLLLPWNGFVAFGLWSHKIIRWTVPFLLTAILATSVLLSSIGMYRWFLAGELAFIACALAGVLLTQMNVRVRLLSYCAYAFLMNLGLLIGFFKFLTGTQKAYWESTPRPDGR